MAAAGFVVVVVEASISSAAVVKEVDGHLNVTKLLERERARSSRIMAWMEPPQLHSYRPGCLLQRYSPYGGFEGRCCWFGTMLGTFAAACYYLYQNISNFILSEITTLNNKLHQKDWTPKYPNKRTENSL